MSRIRLLLTGLLLALLLALAAGWRAREDGVPGTGPVHLGSEPAPAPRPAAAGAAVDARAPGPARESTLSPPPEPPANPHRAAPAQRADDRRRAASEALLGDWAAELRQRAAGGDADAAAALADLLGQCEHALEYTEQPIGEATLRELFAAIGYEEGVHLRLISEFSALAGRCAQLRLNREQLQAQRRAWTARAAELGEPLARLRRAFHESAPDPAARAAHAAQREQLAIELFAEAGPRALIDHALLLSGSRRYASEAYTYAGCQLLPACAADPAGYERAHFSIREFNGDGGFLALRLLGPRERAIAQAQSREIVALWRAGRQGELVRRPEPPNTPGRP